VDLLFSRPAGLLLGRRTRRMYMNEMDLIRKYAQNANGKASQDLEMPKRKKQTTFLLCILPWTSPCNTCLRLRLGPVQTPTMLSYSTCLVGDDEYK